MKKITAKQLADVSGDYKKLSELSLENSTKRGWKNTKIKLEKAFKQIK